MRVEIGYGFSLKSPRSLSWEEGVAQDSQEAQLAPRILSNIVNTVGVTIINCNTINIALYIGLLMLIVKIRIEEKAI